MQRVQCGSETTEICRESFVVLDRILSRSNLSRLYHLRRLDFRDTHRWKNACAFLCASHSNARQTLISYATIVCAYVRITAADRMAAFTSSSDNVAVDASLSLRIFRILFGRPQKQVLRPYADAVVAPMADHKAVWNLSVGENPTKPMRGPNSALSHGALPVAAVALAAGPLPTFAGFVHAPPEQINVFIHTGKLAPLVTRAQSRLIAQYGKYRICDVSPNLGVADE